MIVNSMEYLCLRKKLMPRSELPPAGHLRRCPPPHDKQNGPIHEIGRRRAKIQRQIGNLFGPPQAPHRLTLIQLGTHLFFFMAVVLLEIPLDKSSVYGTWSNAVHSDLGGVVSCQLVRHRVYGSLGGAISEPPLHTH